MNHRRLARVLSVGTLCWFGFGIASTPTSAESNWDLDELRGAIRESRERVTTYEREQRGLLETVEALDRSVAALRRSVARVRSRAETATATLTRLETETRSLRERMRITQRAMAKRAVALYRAGELGPIAMLFAADGIQDWLARVHTLRLLLDHDSELLNRHRIDSAALFEAEKSARSAVGERDAALFDLTARSSELERERAAKRRLVSRLQKDRTRERAALVELETAARALEETLSSLEATRNVVPRAPGASFDSLRAQLPAPVAAPIVKGFGRVVDAEFHTETFHKGVEFAAEMGTPVRTVAPGQVRFAGWFRGYGKLVIVDHGDEYFTVLGHLEEIRVEVGDPVAAGAIIGSVGDTGSLVGARLYFEIRRGGEPQDPTDWLIAGPSG